VVVPPITDCGGAMPVAALNLVPVPADSAPLSHNMGPEQLEAAITPRTRAVVVAHIGGVPADMRGVMEVARRHDIAVVEDCAQAHGACLDGHPAGTFGDISAFSTMGGKHIATADQGGVVFSRNEELIWRCKRFADRGKPFNLNSDGNVVCGLNLNMGDLRAAIGRVQLGKLPDIIASRREVVAEIAEGIEDLDSVSLPHVPAGAGPSWWFLPIQVHREHISVNKEQFARAVEAEGIPVTPAYNHIPFDHPWFHERKTCPTPWHYRTAQLPPFSLENARESIESHFNINIHEDFDARAVRDTVEALRKVDSAYLRRPGT
jgi:dTDP-4-amino-4,6-dideoxygalactose transaminase